MKGTLDFELKSAQFRKERESSWEELEALLSSAERRGLQNLSLADLQRLPTLYRGAVSSLSVARAISLDRNLLAYLTSLASRAYVVVYATKQRPLTAVRRFLNRGLPGAVWRFRRHLAASAGLLALGVLTGFLMTSVDVERYYSFVPSALSAGRGPATPTEELRDVLYHRGGSGAALNAFANFLFAHNAKIGILCFALGFAVGAPVFVLLFYNGLTLGALAAIYADRGLGLEFWAWVLPYGVTELLAVCLCGAGGLVLGMALVFPGERGRLENLAEQGRQAALLVLGAVLLFFLAAGIEGFFRQTVQSLPMRWLMAGSTVLLWLAYFGRRPGRGGS